LGASTERVLLEQEGLVDDPHRVAQRGADHGEHRLASLAVLALARPRPVDVEDDEAEGMPMAFVRLDQLVETPTHVARLEEAVVDFSLR
jgi:hypothetical protein